MELLSILPLLGLGLFAGGLSTVTGVGGGAFAVATIGVFLGPHAALAVTAPALLLGNAHRIWLFRSQLAQASQADRKKVSAFVLGAAPAALIAGLTVTAFPAWVVSLLIVIASMLLVGRKLLGDRIRLRPRLLMVFGAAGGAVTATSGGGGVIIAPTMLAAGLKGGTYVAACSLVAVSIHMFRVPGYAMGGILDGVTLLLSSALAVGLTAGNVLGRRIRRRTSELAVHRLTLLVLSLLIALALLGFVVSLLSV